MHRLRVRRVFPAVAAALCVVGAGTTLAASDQDAPASTSTSMSEASVTPTTAVADVQPAITEHFALFRDQPATGMPADVAAQVGSPLRYGRNPQLARAIKTVTGTGWVIPGDGFLCIAVPDPIDGYGTSCLPTAIAAQQGLDIALWGNIADGKAAETLLVPDGDHAAVAQANGTDVPASADGGVVSLLSDHPGALHLAT